jgi:carboxyl-terminal processing protease
MHPRLTDETMRHRFRASAFSVFFALLAVLWSVGAAAQQSSNLAATGRSSIIAELLDRGHQMEDQKRWGDALTHYEDALREYPGDASLQRRFDFARVHYDLGRRYADRGYCEAVASLPPARALDLYSQVLLKIQTHYVEAPSWKELLERGANNLEIALSEPAFAEKNIPATKRAEVETFRRDLRRLTGSWTVANRNDARDAAASAAQLAQQRLDMRPAAAVLEFVCGASNLLDHYCAFLTADQLNEVYAQIDGNFVGLGIELHAQNNQLVIIRVIPGSPAEQNGVKAGDQILSVDGQDTSSISTDQAANLLQGVEGSVVRLGLVSPGETPRMLSVRRRRVDVPSIDKVAMLDSSSGIAYFKLTCFQKTTTQELDSALWKLKREGMNVLIIDLRGNPGGLLISSVEAADKFLDRGVIVSTRGRNSQEDVTYSARADGTWNTPLVVLIDHDSASAAEIFAGAIRDHHRGTVVGTRSYGKGSVQGIFPLDISNMGIRLTTAKFYSPSGRPYSGTGVEPDVAVRTVARPINGQTSPAPSVAAEDEAMMTAAVQAARNLIQKR